MDPHDRDAAEPSGPRPPDLHDLTRQLQQRKRDLLASAGREAELRWVVEGLRREAAASGAREAALLAETEAAAERLAAMRTVLDAYAASCGPFGLRRKRFLALVRQAASVVPDGDPHAARHAVFEAEARRLTARKGA